MRCTRCDVLRGHNGHYQRYCWKTRQPSELHMCCPDMACETQPAPPPTPAPAGREPASST